MALKFDTNTVTVTGLTGAPTTWDDVEVLGIHVPSGAKYGSCMLAFPEAIAFDSLPALGNVVRVSLNSETIFQGHAVAHPGSVGRGDDRQMLKAVDPRWLLQSIRVGDTAQTPSGGGGFPVVGYRVMFNPDGRRNRAASGTAGLFEFFEGTGSEYWTRKDILVKLLDTYAGGILTVDTATLSAKWDDITYNFVPYGQPLNMVISRLAGECGETWGIAPQATGAAEYVPIVQGGGTLFNVSLAYGDTKADAAANSLMNVQGERSIEFSSDVVEVHTGTTLVERTLNTDDGTLVAGTLSTQDQWEFASKYVVDVGTYQAANLGKNLNTGAKPKPWRRTLNTRIDEAGAFLIPGTAEELDAGRPLRAEECVWIEYEGTRRRVIDGFEVRMESCELLFEPRVCLETGSLGEEERVSIFAGPDKVWFTVVTEIETIDGVRESSTALVTGATLAEVVWRSDIQPMVRTKSDLPEPNNTWTTIAPTTPEVYRAYQPELVAMAQDLLSSQNQVEVNVLVKTLDMTNAVALGRRIVFTGVNCAITDVFYDTREGTDMLQVRATSNLSRVIF